MSSFHSSGSLGSSFLKQIQKSSGQRLEGERSTKYSQVVIDSGHGALSTEDPNPKWFDFNTTFHVIKYQVPKNDEFLAVLFHSWWQQFLHL